MINVKLISTGLSALTIATNKSIVVSASNVIVAVFSFSSKLIYSLPASITKCLSSESVETFNISPALNSYVNKGEDSSAVYTPRFFSSPSYHWNVAAVLLKSTVRLLSAEGC